MTLDALFFSASYIARAFAGPPGWASSSQNRSTADGGAGAADLSAVTGAFFRCLSNQPSICGERSFSVNISVPWPAVLYSMNLFAGFRDQLRIHRMSCTVLPSSRLAEASTGSQGD